MRILYLAPIALLISAAACNSGSSVSSTPDTTVNFTDSMTHDTSMTSAQLNMQPPPAGAKVFFKNLKDGQTVTSPLKVEMGVSGIALDTAGSMAANTGHHHLLVDAGDSIPMGTVIPKDSTHIHFGKAQTETTVTLTPGEHRLTLQLADGMHRSYGTQLATSITVKVKK